MSRYDIKITEKTQMETHQITRSRYIEHKIYIGDNPRGPKGGTCGNVEDAVEVYTGSYNTKWLQKVKYALYIYIKALKAIGEGTLLNETLTELKTFSKKRSTTNEDCVYYLLKTINKQHYPLLINAFDPEDNVDLNKLLT